jgi:hypothetical protein
MAKRHAPRSRKRLAENDYAVIERSRDSPTRGRRQTVYSCFFSSAPLLPHLPHLPRSLYKGLMERVLTLLVPFGGKNRKVPALIVGFVILLTILSVTRISEFLDFPINCTCLRLAV